MSTKALETILYRDLSIAEGKEMIDLVSPLLKEMVNYSTNVLARCAPTPTTQPRNPDEDVAVFALYRHIIELTDGIEVLLSKCCAVPTVPLLRSSFEALISLEYILENDSDYAKRSLSWLVGYTHQRIASYEIYDPSTTRGQQFQISSASDNIFSSINLPPNLDVQAQKGVSNLQSFLQEPHIQPIETEYQTFNRKPHWYTLFGGPKSLVELCKHLNRAAFYDVLYRGWSRVTHSQDLLPFLDRTQSGEAAIGRIRNPKQLKEVSSFPAVFLLSATRIVLKKFRPGEVVENGSLSKWYIQEIQKDYKKIISRSAEN